MSTFCGGSGAVPAFTPTQLLDAYTNGLVPLTLPPMTNGLATDAWVTSHIETLSRSGIIPNPGPASQVQSNPGGPPEAVDPLSTFVQRETEFQNRIKAEYCFYESRYFNALDGFLQAVSSSLTTNAQTAVINAKLDLARRLNQKVILMTQIVNGIAKDRYAKSSTFQSDINSLNSKLGQRATSLREQNTILMRESAAADLNMRMVEYTVEKNKANQNLLTLYGVLNIVAISMLFYIARS
jgi:hypothetical protein